MPYIRVLYPYIIEGSSVYNKPDRARAKAPQQAVKVGVEERREARLDEPDVSLGVHQRLELLVEPRALRAMDAHACRESSRESESERPEGSGAAKRLLSTRSESSESGSESQRPTCT